MVTTPAGCTSNAQGGGLVNALPGPVADFTASPWSTNMDDPTVDLTNTSTGSVQQWLWSFGDGDTSAQGSPSHTYSAPGSYPVSLWVADVNGCADSIVHIIRIDPVYETRSPRHSPREREEMEGSTTLPTSAMMYSTPSWNTSTSS